MSVGGRLGIRNTDVLQALDGLQKVHSVGGLDIGGNAALQSLAALNALENVTGDLVIVGNLQLPQSDAEAFAAGLTVGGTATVADNRP